MSIFSEQPFDEREEVRDLTRIIQHDIAKIAEPQSNDKANKAFLALHACRNPQRLPDLACNLASNHPGRGCPATMVGDSLATRFVIQTVFKPITKTRLLSLQTCSHPLPVMNHVYLRLTRDRPGRSVSACQKAFDNLYARVYQIPLQPVGQAPQPSPSAKPRKRPAASGDISTGLNRELQPRTPGFVTVNEPTELTAYPPGLADSLDQRRKKRGRPSKAEVEVKAAEYAARGEPYPPPRRSKNPKPSAEGVSTMGPSITFTPVTMGPSPMEGTSSGKKRTPKAKAQKDDMIPQPKPTASAAQQLHSETRDPARIGVLPGYGPTASPIGQVYSEARDLAPIDVIPRYRPSASPIQQVLNETRDPTRTDVISGYGPTASPTQQVLSETRDPTGIYVPPSQAPQTDTTEPTVVGVAPAAQDRTTGGNVTRSQPQESAEVMPSEGYNGREEASVERRYEAEHDKPQASSTMHEQAPTEHDPSNVTPSAQNT